MSSPSSHRLIFKEPLLNFPFWQRFLIKLANYVLVVGLGLLTFILFGSNDVRLEALALLIVLFLFDLLIRKGRYLITIDSQEAAGTINVASYLSNSSYHLLLKAFQNSEINRADINLALLNELIKNTNILNSFLRLDLPIKQLFNQIKSESKIRYTKTPFCYSFKTNKEKAEKIGLTAYQWAKELKQPYIQPSSLFLALFETEENLMTEIFSLFNITKMDLVNAFILSSLPIFKSKQLIKGVAEFYSLKKKYGQKFKMDRAWLARPTPFLDRFSLDFTELARRARIGFLIGHEREYQLLIQTLSRSGKNNALLIGEAGSGRETMVAYLALMITRDAVPNKLKDKRLIALNISDLISGAKNSAEVLDRFNQIAQEVREAGNIILYLPDFHNLKTTIEEKSLTPLEALKPLFSLEEVMVIGALTNLNYHQYFENDSDINQCFEIIRVEEISLDEAIRILTYEALTWEKTEKVIISYKAIKRAVDLASRFIKSKLLPSSAEDLIKEAIIGIKQAGRRVLTEEDMVKLVSLKTKIPLTPLAETEKEKLLNLEAEIHKRLINQEEAVKAVASVLREYRTGLSRKKGPIASLLFVGPTGVGKTELAKTLAQIYFNQENAMVRFDMSEYQDIKAIYRFIGSPDGQITGVLTEAIKATPFSLVLLDEFEKAHPDILNLFLAVFDEGRLTDNLGTTISFENTIIIATSNALSDVIRELIKKGIDYEELEKIIKDKLGGFFQPELLNRFDEIIVFKPLTLKHIQQICQLQLSELSAVLKENKGITLSFDESVILKLSNLGYNPVYGARPLRAVIRNFIRDSISQMILKDEIKQGDRLLISYQDNRFCFNKIIETK